MNRFFYYIKIWWMMSKNSFLAVMSQKFLLLLFLFGKLLRFGFFMLFLIYLVRGTGSIAGYSINQSIFFYLTFNLIDVIGQFLFREVYRFRTLVVSGDFDLVLVKPTSALFRVLMGGADVIDLITIPPLIFAVYYVGNLLNPQVVDVLLYALLVFNALIIATSFHIAVLAFGIITLEVDYLVMIYRDIVNLGRFPIDIYKQPLRGLLTFIIPVAVMITLPAQAFMGLISIKGVLLSFTIAIVALLLSLKFWNRALKSYTSASS